MQRKRSYMNNTNKKDEDKSKIRYNSREAMKYPKKHI